MRLIYRYSWPRFEARVYRNHTWQEYVTRFYTDNTHHKDADYHTNDRADAIDTAQAWVKTQLAKAAP